MVTTQNAAPTTTDTPELPKAQIDLIQQARERLKAERAAREAGIAAQKPAGGSASVNDRDKKRAEQQRERDEARKKREEERAAKRDQRAKERKLREMERERAKQEKLPDLTPAAQAIMNAVLGDDENPGMTAPELGALAIHLRFHADEAARNAPKEDIEPGDVVLIHLAQHPRYTGKVGVVHDVSKVRAHVRVPGFEIDAYAYVTNLEKVDEKTLKPRRSAPPPPRESNILDVKDDESAAEADAGPTSDEQDKGPASENVDATPKPAKDEKKAAAGAKGGRASRGGK